MRCRRQRWQRRESLPSSAASVAASSTWSPSPAETSSAGPFRETLTNDDWRALVPKRDNDPFANDTKLDDVVPTHEYTAGGPVIKDRVWFFTAGRDADQRINRQLVITNIPYVFTDKSQRFEGKVTYSLDSNHRVQGRSPGSTATRRNDTFNTTHLDGHGEPLRSQPARGPVHPQLHGRHYTELLPRRAVFAAQPDVCRKRQHVHRPHSGHVAGRSGRAPLQRRRPSAVSAPTRSATIRTSSSRARTSCRRAAPARTTFVVGYDSFNDVRLANNYQSGSNYRFINAPAFLTGPT